MNGDRILLVEDDKEIREGVEIFLKSQGYAVFQAADGVEGLKVLEEREIDLAIVDVMMPRMDGITMTAKLREKYDFPVIFLSAKSEEVDKILGLNMGADDYMVKPFGVLELSARIRSLLRRTKREEDRDVLFYQDIQVNRKTREVSSGGRLVELTLKEFELLVYLLENQSRVVTRDELLNRIWGYEYDGETRTLDMHIRTLRQKLGEEGGACIKTVRGVGYRMVR